LADATDAFAVDDDSYSVADEEDSVSFLDDDHETSVIEFMPSDCAYALFSFGAHGSSCKCASECPSVLPRPLPSIEPTIRPLAALATASKPVSSDSIVTVATFKRIPLKICS
jgi:hypothetical protein